MKHIFWLLIFCLLPLTAWAQDKSEEKNFTPMFEGRNSSDASTGSEYKMYVYDALEMKPGFDFGYFRALYSDTKNYAPLAEDIQKEIYVQAFKVKTLPLSPERSEAMDKYTDLILRHLANMDIVLTALALSREDKKFGSPELYKWLYKGLLQSVATSGNGTKLTDAFYVITMGEETALLAKIGLRVKETKPVKEGLVYYNMHSVYDPRRQVEYTIFVDTTKPMAYLETLESQKPKDIFAR